MTFEDAWNLGATHVRQKHWPPAVCLPLRPIEDSQRVAAWVPCTIDAWLHTPPPPPDSWQACDAWGNPFGLA